MSTIYLNKSGLLVNKSGGDTDAADGGGVMMMMMMVMEMTMIMDGCS